MFSNKIKKNRKFTARKYEQEVKKAKIWCKPPKQFIFNTPFYPGIPPTPLINFHLNFK